LQLIEEAEEGGDIKFYLQNGLPTQEGTIAIKINPEWIVLSLKEIEGRFPTTKDEANSLI